MDRERFARGRTYERYASGMESNRAEAEAIYREVGVPVELREFLTNYAARHGGTLHIAVFTDDRCVDCLENVPVLASLVSEVPAADLRVFTRAHDRDLLEQLFPQGETRIPAFAFYDAGWRHLMTWVERPEGATRFLSEGRRELRRRLHEEYRNRFRIEMLEELRAGLKAAEEL